MNRCSTPHFSRVCMQAAIIFACLMLCIPRLSHAASATLNFNFNGVEARASALVAPTQAGSTANTYAPVFKSVQATTEIVQTVVQPQPVESAPITVQPAETAPVTTQPAESAPATAQPTEAAPGGSVRPAPAAKGAPKIGIGIDTTMSNDLKIYTIPVSYALNRNFALQLTLPFVTAKFADTDDLSHTNNGLGDVGLTLKHRIGSENSSALLYSLLTVKLATGNANQGLGTGTYDLALTEKVIKRFGIYRVTLMGGIIQPLNDPTILDSKIEFGTTFSYMAAAERTFFVPDFWCGIRTEGLHTFESRIDGIAQGNALTTLDLAPELKYYFKRGSSINFGINIPVYTNYALVGGAKTRQLSANFGISTMF